MPRKCPPGVICIENATIIFFLLIISLILYFLIKVYPLNKPNTNVGIFPQPSYSFSNLPNDVFLNPYSAPEKNDNYYRNPPIQGVPINVSTRDIDSEYRQIGILTRNSGPEMILPLFGRPIDKSRDKWQFYTTKDNSLIKLPVIYKNKSCSDTNGCDNIYNSDTVYVEGYKDVFLATIYENQTMKYIPYI